VTGSPPPDAGLDDLIARLRDEEAGGGDED
jgi:hypothetical protein